MCISCYWEIIDFKKNIEFINDYEMIALLNNISIAI